MEIYLTPGTIIDGRYRVEGVLGEGGMSVVLLARSLHLNQRVAIKLLKREVLRDPAVGKRFEREARAAASLKSEHAARTFDVGHLPDGSLYIVMEYLQGEDLQAMAERAGPMPILDIAIYILMACEALDECHAKNIIHRDLKPANLFAVQKPNQSVTLKLVDFGVSKMPPRGETVLTGTRELLGTPYYMSPEQVNSPKAVDHRTDLWGIGVILYQLSTGTYPFDGLNWAELMKAIVSRDPEPPQERRPDMPTEFARIIERCLKKSPEDRYPDIRSLVRDLAPFAPGIAALLFPWLGAGAAIERTRLLEFQPTVTPLHRTVPHSLPPPGNEIRGESATAPGPRKSHAPSEEIQRRSVHSGSRATKGRLDRVSVLFALMGLMLVVQGVTVGFLFKIIAQQGGLVRTVQAEEGPVHPTARPIQPVTVGLPPDTTRGHVANPDSTPSAGDGIPPKGKSTVGGGSRSSNGGTFKREEPRPNGGVPPAPLPPPPPNPDESFTVQIGSIDSYAATP